MAPTCHNGHMGKKPSSKPPRDVNALASFIIDQATGTEKPPTKPTKAESEAAAKLSQTRKVAGKKGGQKGGPARAESLTPEQRSEIAKKAAKSRWNHQNQEEGQG